MVPLWCALALVGLALSGLAAAQLQFSTFTLFGKGAPSVLLGGVEYARDSVLGNRLNIDRSGDLIRVRGLGHTLLLPLAPDAARATGGDTTVQLDAARVVAHTATLIHGNLYLPLDTLARGLGAEYAPGRLSVPAPRLSGVASRAGAQVDRLVLELNRTVNFRTQMVGGRVELILPGTSGAEQTYSTKGRYLPRVRVQRGGDALVVSAPLPVGSGFRAYVSGEAAGGAVNVVLDVGPGIAPSMSALRAKLRRPLIVLDPVADLPGLPGDAALEVAREVGDLLTQSGWQVRSTRSGGEPASLEARAELARASDVFLSLGVASLPGASAGGVTLYEAGGDSGLALTDAVRADGAPSRRSRPRG